MKQRIFAGALLVAAAHAMAGGTPRDSDGVPKVDVHGTIVVVEKASTKMDSGLLLTFCPGKPTNATCDQASRIDRIDSASGPKEQLPKGCSAETGSYRNA